LLFYVLLGRTLLEETQAVIRSGVETMMCTAYRILGGRARPNAVLRIARDEDTTRQAESDEDGDSVAVPTPDGEV
jgi:hypothetical protein